MDKGTIVLDGKSLTLEQLEEVARGRKEVSVAEQAKKGIRSSRALVEKLVQEQKPLYGVTTGVGMLEKESIPRDKIEELQVNLILSHAAGVGDPLPDDAVRGAMLLRLNVFARGHSGVRLEVCELLKDMLNRGVHPLVPEKGSVGASGDLAPLAHIALVMMGGGEVLYEGKRLEGGKALRRAGLSPIAPKAKEGVALLNGPQVTTSIGSLVLLDSERLTKVADIAGAMSLDALKGSTQPFDERIHQLRPYRGAINTASNVKKLLDGSEIRESHLECPRVQDAYSLRCIPQVCGGVRELLRWVRAIFEIEINSASDNPLLFPETGEVLSGGSFHGQPLALALDSLATGLAVLASISERRTARLMDPKLSGLPPFLTEVAGISSGYMSAQVTAASLVSENKILAHPASSDSIPTSANQEDFVPMATSAGRKAREIYGNAERVVAIELLCGSQGIDLHHPLRTSPVLQAVHGRVRRDVPKLVKDREIYKDIEKMVELVSSGEVLKAAEETLGESLL